MLDRQALSFRRRIAGASVFALATALAATPSRAQLSYNAPDPTVVSGNVDFLRGEIPGQETYTINSPTAVLDFTPSDVQGTGVIAFQNPGTTVIYEGSSNFTVLNRIVPLDPSRPIQFDGTVNARLVDPQTGNATPGGSVWFYSPGGIILGSGSVFDVGSLLLSTADPTGGSGSISSTTSFRLSSAAGSNAAVTVSPGARITASPQGSYVALVAPRVVQNGDVRVNGSAAYVAAEDATLTINQGLFDISVAVGSDGLGTPLTHNGTTTGPASTGAGDLQGIFMVAVPKNSAVTMLIAPNGQLGFDVAAGATVENGAIYLQAGGDLAVSPTQAVVNRINDLPQSALAANIQLTAPSITSPIAAQASGDLIVTAAAGGTSLAGEAYFYGARNATLTAPLGGSFTTNRDLIVNSFGNGAPGRAQIDALNGSTMRFSTVQVSADGLSGRILPTGFDLSTGGTAALRSTGGTITASGVTRISAVGSPAANASARGGSADITATAGGLVDLASSASVLAGASTSGTGNTATGGNGNLFADGGTIRVGSGLTIDAAGTSSFAASGVGGSASIVTGANGGTIQVNGGVTALLALGSGGAGSGSPGGSGTGGNATIHLQPTTGGATANVSLGVVNMQAGGAGGNGSGSGSAGGNGTGGSSRLLAQTGGTFTASGAMTLNADGSGGNGGAGGAGGNATGGNVQVQAGGGSITGQSFSLSGQSFGGFGGNGPVATVAGGSGGRADAGTGVTISADSGGSVTGASVQLSSSSFGGTGGSGALGSGLAGNGGAARSSAAGAFTASNGRLTFATLSIDSSARGGSTGSGLAQPGAVAGAGQAGDAFVTVNTGRLQTGDLFMTGNGFGGDGNATGSSGGDGAGGANVSAGAMNGGALVFTGGSVDISAFARGGLATSISGNVSVTGGRGQGGVAALFAETGSTIDSSATFVSIDASGAGGVSSGANAGNGGAGQGGIARLVVNSGSAADIRSDAALSADGDGGFTFGTGTGGAGTGGLAIVLTDSGNATNRLSITGDLDLQADGFGGSSSLGMGGAGLGGNPADVVNGPFDKGAILAAFGGTLSVGGSADLSATGFGGDGATGGGAGTGGYTEFSAFGAAVTVAGSTDIDSSGLGGDGDGGASGGIGRGGTSLVLAASGAPGRGVPLGTPSSITLASLFQDASGEGGRGGDGADGQAGGTGGDGFGGTANAIGFAGSGRLDIGTAIVFQQGVGGDGGTGGNGAAGGRGGSGTAGSTNFGTASGPATTTNSGSATFGDVTVFGVGVGGAGGDGGAGGNGGAGGSAQGGNAVMLSRGSPAVAGTVSVDASAFGGIGGAGVTEGAGGNATGGTAGFLSTNRFNRTERGSLTATSFSATASALGGTGSTTGASTGGQLLVQVSQADAALDSLDLFSFGDNGPPAGSESTISVDNGTLSVATNLSVSVAGDLGLFVFDNGVLRANSFFLEATGALLPPPAGGGQTPGIIDVATDFSAFFGGDFVTSANFDVDGSVSIVSERRVQTGNVTAGGSVELSGTDGVTAGNVTGADFVALGSSAGSVNAGDLTATGLGFVSVQAATDVTVGAVRADDSVSLFAGGNLTSGDVTAALGNQPVISGDVEIGASGAIQTGAVRGATIDIFNGTPGAAIVTGDLTAETIGVLGAGTVRTGNLATGDFYSGIDTSADNYLIGVGANGNLTVGDVTAFTSVGLGSETGSVGAGRINANDSVMILAKSGVTANGITAGSDTGDNIFISDIGIIDRDPIFAGFTGLQDFDSTFDPKALATATPLRLGGAISFGGPVSARNVAAAAASGITANAITATERLALDSGTFLSLGDVTTAVALRLDSDGPLSVGNLVAPSVDLASRQSVSAQSINATGAVNVTASGTASFQGAVAAPQITVTSADLQLGAAGRLGSASTTQLTLNAPGASGFTFGGSGAASGYSLSAAEAQALRAQRISITTASPVTIEAVTLAGGGDANPNLAGSTGQLTLDTNGGITVNGAFVLANATSGNRVTLRSGDRIAIVSDAGGSLALTGASPGTLGGTLELIGNRIVAGQQSLLTQLAANPNFAGRNQALAAPPAGSPKPEGVIQAGRIELEALDLLAIQNSNTATQFGGFSAGAGGMQVRNRQAATPLDVIIYGRVADPSGAFKTNGDAAALITFGAGGSGNFVAGSLVNNCAVAGSCGGPGGDIPAQQEIVIDRIPAVIAAAVESALSSATDPEEVAALPVVNLVTTIDAGQLRTDPVISDPVSGGGNPSLWDAPDDEERRREGQPRPASTQGGKQ